MLYHNIVFSLTVIAQLFNCIAAYTAEGLINGFEGDRSQVKYNVLITGQQNYSSEYLAICNGVIVSQNFVLTIANCIRDAEGDLRKLTFYVAMDITSLLNKDMQKIVKEIYFTHANPSLDDRRFAVLKVREPYNKEIKLELLEEKELFSVVTTIFAYSYVWDINERNNVTHYNLTTTGRNDIQLSRAYVRTLSIPECLKILPYISHEKEICGMLIPITVGMSRNTYLGDSGIPLIVENKLVGLASKIVVNKNAQLIPDVYIKVSHHAENIKRILNNQGRVVLENRPHYLSEEIVV